MISTAVERSAHLIGSYLDRTIGDLGLSQAEAHVMVALSERGAMPIGALHRTFGHKPSTLTNVVDRLERQKLVRRRPNPNDRRSVLISLTSSGERVAERVLDALNRLNDHLSATVAARDLKGVENVTAALVALVDQLDSTQ